MLFQSCSHVSNIGTLYIWIKTIMSQRYIIYKFVKACSHIVSLHICIYIFIYTSGIFKCSFFSFVYFHFVLYYVSRTKFLIILRDYAMFRKIYMSYVKSTYACKSTKSASLRGAFIVILYLLLHLFLIYEF